MSTQRVAEVLKAAFTVLRDVILLGVGVLGILHQEFTGKVHPELLLVYSALFGVPGTIGLVQLLRGKPETPSTVDSSLPSPAVRQSAD